MLGGDLRGHVALESLAAAPNLYGLGPLEGLRGEVSIFGSALSIARIERGAVVTTASWKERACFLVWAQVEAWSEQVSPSGLTDLDEMEQRVVTLAREAGLDPERPFPFRLHGTAAAATLHVLDKRDGLPHSPQRHEYAKVRRTLADAPVELVGFHSTRHRGVFTPRESNLHVHLRTEDGRISGHLEEIRLDERAQLAVPATGWPQ